MQYANNLFAGPLINPSSYIYFYQNPEGRKHIETTHIQTFSNPHHLLYDQSSPNQNTMFRMACHKPATTATMGWLITHQSSVMVPEHRGTTGAMSSPVPLVLTEGAGVIYLSQQSHESTQCESNRVREHTFRSNKVLFCNDLYINGLRMALEEFTGSFSCPWTFSVILSAFDTQQPQHSRWTLNNFYFVSRLKMNWKWRAAF